MENIMRGIRLVIELGTAAAAQDLRYQVRLGDGRAGPTYTFALMTNQYSRGQWIDLLGYPYQNASWTTESSEGMYITIERQEPNPDFDFADPHAYERREWLKGQWPVDEFRLLNPWIGRPIMSWYRNNRWTDHRAYSEGTCAEFTYTVDDYSTPMHETGKFTVTRRDDSDLYKEFVIVLGA